MPRAHATGNLLGKADREILDFCVEEDRVCATNNADDFRELVGDVELHPGLIVLPNVARNRQSHLLDAALAFIEQEAADGGQEPRDLMVNHIVEIDEHGTAELYELPHAA